MLNRGALFSPLSPPGAPKFLPPFFGTVASDLDVRLYMTYSH
jgi:hypothetical protein